MARIEGPISSSEERKSRLTKKRSIFPGLKPYGESDQELFAGRERYKYSLLKKLNEDSFISIQGSNSVGKTSFVNCLILPELRSGYLVQGRSKWRIAKFRPGKDPISALALALSESEVIQRDLHNKVDPNLSDQFEKTLRYKRYGIVDILEEFDLTTDANLLLFIDQLDELHSYSDPTLADIFIQRIVEAANQSAYPIHIITASRTEQVGSFAAKPEFAELINRNHFLLPQMEVKEIHEVFSKVSQSGKIVFRPAFIDRVLESYKSNTIDLSKFQFAMYRCSQEVASDKGVKTLGVIHLKTIGGLNGAIENKLDSIYNSLSSDDKQACKTIFQGLTGITSLERMYARYCSLEELHRLTELPYDRLSRVIQIFASDQAQVLEVRQSKDIKSRLEQLDVIHVKEEKKFTSNSVIHIFRDIIIDSWPRLQSWIEEDAVNAQIYFDIAEAARKKDHPFQGEKLKSTWSWYNHFKPSAGWASRYHDGYKPAIEFLEKSKALADREAETRKAEEISREQKSKRNKKIIAGFLGVALLLLAISIFEKRDADMQSAKAMVAEESAIKASARAALDSSNAAAAVMRAIMAVRKADTSEQNAKQAALEAEEAKLRAMALRSESEQLTYNVQQKELELERAVVEMNKSRVMEEYLGILSKIRELAEESNKIFTRSEDKNQLNNGARIALEAYRLFNTTTDKKYQQVRDSVQVITELAQKKLFSSMNLAIQKVGKPESLQDISGGVVVEKIVGLINNMATGIFLIGTNDLESSIYEVRIIKGEVESVKKLTQAYSSEYQAKGLKTLAVSNSKQHFIVSHLPSVQNVRYISSFSMDGGIQTTSEFKYFIKSAYPFGQGDFLVADDKANVYILRRTNNSNFALSSVLTSNDELMDIDYEPVTSSLVIARSNRNLAILTFNDKEELEELNKFKLTDFNSEITRIKYIPKFSWLVVGNRKGELYFYDSNSGALVYSALNEHENNINVLELSPEGDMLVSGGRDRNVNVWDLNELNQRINQGGSISKYQPIQFAENESVRDVVFLNEDWIMVVSSSEGISSAQTGGVSLLPLNFDITGKELEKLIK